MFDPQLDLLPNFFLRLPLKEISVRALHTLSLNKSRSERKTIMLLFDHPIPLFFTLLFVLSVFVEIGHRAGLRMSIDTDSLRHEQLVAARDAIGLLLSLLLGFTLAMAIARFDHRKQLLVDEANSISTTALRARTLPEPLNAKVLGLLREYVEARARFSAARLEGQDLQQSIVAAKRLQDQLWEQAVLVAKTTPTAITSLFIQSLNETIDLSETPGNARESRSPSDLGDVDIDFAVGLPDRGHERSAEVPVRDAGHAAYDRYRDGTDRRPEQSSRRPAANRRQKHGALAARPLFGTRPKIAGVRSTRIVRGVPRFDRSSGDESHTGQAPVDRKRRACQRCCAGDS